MVFALRIDLESDKGIREGVPKILALLNKFNFKASFYLVMGGESNIFEILKHRGNLESAGERKIKIWSLKEKLRMALFPKDFVLSNKRILEQILKDGHELGIHGWKHRIWTRSFKKINIKKQISLAIKKYWEVFRKRPFSFAAPAFRTNEATIDFLNKNGIEVISDLPGIESTKIKGTQIVNVPITIKGEKNTPIIEYLSSEGKNDEEILSILKKEIKKNKISVMYVHGLYECLKKIELLERLFLHLKKNKIKVSSIEDIAKSLK